MVFETYHMDHAKGLMIVDCKDADTEEPDLKDPRCLGAILSNLSKELRVDGLVLNHFREKHYGRKTLKALREVIVLSTVLDQLGKQDPLPNFGSLGKKDVQARCRACHFNPGSLFGRMKELLLSNLPRIDCEAFKSEFTFRVGELARHGYKGCQNCVKRTVDDLSYLLTELERFADALMPRDWRK